MYGRAMDLDLFAGIRVRDYEAAKSWYERLLGKAPTFFPNATEAVWELAEHRYVFIVEDRDAAGGANNLIWVDDLEALVAEISSPPSARPTRTAYAKWSIATWTGTSSGSAALPSRVEAVDGCLHSNRGWHVNRMSTSRRNRPRWGEVPPVRIRLHSG
jgi:hypothetical protein